MVRSFELVLMSAGRRVGRGISRYNTLSFRTSVILGLTRSSRYWRVLKVPERSIAADRS